MNPAGKRWLAAILVLVGACSYGMLSPMIKLAYADGWTDNQISAGQMLWGAVMMWPIVLLRPKKWSNPFRGPWIKLALTGIFGLALTTVVLNGALNMLDASFAVVLLFQFTWMTVLLEWIIYKKRPAKSQLLSIAIVLIGTFLTAGFSLSALHGAKLAGIGLGLLSALTYSLFILFTGKIRSELDPAMRSVVMLTAAIPIVFLLYPPILSFSGDTVQLMGWGIVFGLLGQIIPTVCFNIGIPVIGGGLAALLGSVELPVAVIGAQLLLHESIGILQWIGILFILAGIAVAELKSGELPKRESQEESS